MAFIQAIVSGSLYFLSTHPPKILESKVLAPGFWVPFGDAENYFEKSRTILSQGMSYAAKHPPSSLYVMFLTLAGWGSSEPILSALWMNGLLHVAIPVVGYSFLRFSSGPKEAFWGAFGMSLLPSGYVYASQLLREPLIWLILVSGFGLVLAYLSLRKIRLAWAGIALLICVGLLTEMRSWMGYTFGLAALVLALRTPGDFQIYRRVGLVLLVMGGLFLGQQGIFVRGVTGWGREVAGVSQREVALASGQKTQIQQMNLGPLSQGRIRIGAKARELSQRVPVSLVFLGLDLAFVFLWRWLKKKNLTLGAQDDWIWADSGRIFFGVFAASTGLVALFYSDSLGNMARYVFPVFLAVVWLGSLPRENKALAALPGAGRSS